MMAPTPTQGSNSSSNLFRLRLFKHGSSSSANASVMLPSGRELQAEIYSFKTEAPANPPTEDLKKLKLDIKTPKALQGVTSPAHDKGLSSEHEMDLDTNSDGDCDIPALAQPKHKSTTKVANSAKVADSQATEPSAPSTKRKHSSLENTIEGGSISKRRARKIPARNAATTSEPEMNEEDLQGKTFMVEKILAKGWMTHKASEGKGVDRKREWCYLIQWAKSEDGKTWKPTWEPVSTMYDGGDKQAMAEQFENRMEGEDSDGAPTWVDVLGEEDEIEGETKQEKIVAKKKGKQ